MLCGVEIDGILVERDRATGLALEDGRRIEGVDFVVSGLNPQQTLLELTDANHVDAAIRDRAERFEYNLLAPLFALNLALSEPPSYQATTDDSDLDQAFMTILGLGHDGQFDEILRSRTRKYTALLKDLHELEEMLASGAISQAEFDEASVAEFAEACGGCAGAPGAGPGPGSAAAGDEQERKDAAGLGRLEGP